MKTLFLDANIFLYAIGAESPHREVCQQVLVAVGEGRLDGISDAEVLQELLHVRRRRLTAQHAAETVHEAISMLRQVLPVTGANVLRASRLLEAQERLSARDALHVAVMEAHGVHLLVSLDADFDGLPMLQRLTPSEALALASPPSNRSESPGQP